MRGGGYGYGRSAIGDREWLWCAHMMTDDSKINTEEGGDEKCLWVFVFLGMLHYLQNTLQTFISRGDIHFQWGEKAFTLIPRRRDHKVEILTP